MERWVGRVAVVTGASAGIGAAIVQQLVDHGLIVVALARRADKIEEAVSKARQTSQTPCSKATSGKLHTRQCDVTKEESILSAFQWVKENLGGVDVLINNAGVVGETALTAGNTEEWRRILDTNVLGLCICTREAVKSMRERGVDDGHIIHIGSCYGHILPISSESAVYSASKHAVRALTEGLRKDLAASKSKIKISAVSPGLVKTEILDNLSVDPEKVFGAMPHLQSEDVAGAVLYALGTPPHVQIHDIIIKPLGESF